MRPPVNLGFTVFTGRRIIVRRVKRGVARDVRRAARLAGALLVTETRRVRVVERFLAVRPRLAELRDFAELLRRELDLDLLDERDRPRDLERPRELLPRELRPPRPPRRPIKESPFFFFEKLLLMLLIHFGNDLLNPIRLEFGVDEIQLPIEDRLLLRLYQLLILTLRLDQIYRENLIV